MGNLDSGVSVDNPAYFKSAQYAVGIIFVVYLAWHCSQLIWFVVDDVASVVPVSMDSRGANSVAQKTVARPVERYKLFGEAGRVVVSDVQKKEAPKTNLRLSLKGVFTGDEAERSGAIIEEIGKGTESYRIGDALPGGATLAEVYADRVLLDRSGRLEALYFDEVSANNSRVSNVIRQERPEARRVSTPNEFIDEATRRIAEDPERALKSVGLSFADGEGYVFQGNNPMLSNMNLKKGDIIRSVNGQPLGDINQDKEMMRSLAQQDSIEVEVVRDGASFYVNYPLR